jgi:hypothetical protein
MERTCKKCGETKPIEEFAFARKYKDKHYYSHTCKICYNKYREQWRKMNFTLCKQEQERNRNKHLIRVKKYSKKRTDNLHELYIAHIISQSTGLSIELIRQHSSLIENYRYQILIKRLLKQRRHEKTCTS